MVAKKTVNLKKNVAKMFERLSKVFFLDISI